MVPQQTGVPPIIMQQVQPALRQAAIQSQQPWIIAMQAASPLVQVITQPSLVISHLQVPIIRLQLQQTIPFIMQQQLHMLPASMVHRFCIMAQATASSHLQVIFIPPVIFSTIILQRGTIIMPGAIAPVELVIGEEPIVGIPIPMPGRSIIIVLVMVQSFYGVYSGRGGCDAVSHTRRVTKSESDSNKDV